MTTKVFNYGGNAITFQNGDHLMVNATEMAKPFGRMPNDWTRQKSTDDYLKSLASVRGIPVSQLIISQKGNSNQFVQGTWMHEDVAMEFARWLNPSFAIWCNDRIKELLTHGATAVNPDDLLNPDFIIKVATELKKERQLKEAAEAKVKALQPKAELMSKVLDTDEKIDIGQAAKILELPFGRNTMFKQLKERGVFFKNRNEPKQTYITRGYFQLKEKFIERNNHDGFTVIKVLVTQKGLEFLSKLFGVTEPSKSMAHIN